MRNSFKDYLDQFAIGGAPLGLWMAQQGSIICFVALLVVYARWMNKLDEKHGLRRRKIDGPNCLELHLYWHNFRRIYWDAIGPVPAPPRNITPQVVVYLPLLMVWQLPRTGCPQQPLFPWLEALQPLDMVHQNSWWGGPGFVLLTTLMVPYLRKFGKATVPDFIGDRFYSNGARLVAVICAIFICDLYNGTDARRGDCVFSTVWYRNLDGSINRWRNCFFHAGLGGMKGITYTQVAVLRDGFLHIPYPLFLFLLSLQVM